MQVALTALCVSLRRDPQRHWSELVRWYSPAKEGGGSAAGNDDHEAAFYHARGQLTSLTDARPARLLSQLRQAEDALFRERPVAVTVNTYEAHHAVQVTLRDCSIWSFVFDGLSGDLLRVYSDLSAREFLGSGRAPAAAVPHASAVLLMPDRMVMALDSPQLLAVVNPGRDKAKRPYLAEKAGGVVRLVDTPARQARSLSLSPGGQLVAAAFAQSVCLYKLDRTSEPADASLPAGVVRPRLALDLAAMLRLAEGSSVVLAQFCRRSPGALLLVTEDRASSGSVAGRRATLAHARYDEAGSSLALAGQLAGVEAGGARATCASLSLDEERAVVGFADGTLVLVRVPLVRPQPGPLPPPGAAPPAELRRVVLPGRHEPLLLRWHPSGALVVAAFANGDVVVLDAALQAVSLVGEDGDPVGCLSLGPHLPFPAQVVDAAWGPQAGRGDAAGQLPALGTGLGAAAADSQVTAAAVPFAASRRGGGSGGVSGGSRASTTAATTAAAATAAAADGSSRHQDVAHDALRGRRAEFDAHSLALVLDRGPLVVLRLRLGSRVQLGRRPGVDGCGVVAAWLRACDPARAEALVGALPEERRALAELLVLRWLSRHRPASPELGAALRRSWARHASPADECHRDVFDLVCRHFQWLCASGRLEDAWAAAELLGDVQLFREIQLRAVAAGQTSLADMAQSRVRSLVTSAQHIAP